MRRSRRDKTPTKRRIRVTKAAPVRRLREILICRTYMGLSIVTQRKRKRKWKQKIGLSRTMKKNLQISLRKCIRGKEMQVRILEAVLTHSTVKKS